MEEQELSGLLRENIEASNRTTHAVRALTTFIVYEAAYSLVVGILLASAFFPALTLDEPLWFLVVVAAGIAIGGLYHSFKTAFGELSNSEVTAFRIARPAGGISPSRLKRTQMQAEDDEPLTVLPGNCDCGTVTRRSAGAQTVGDSYVCRNCQRAIFDYS